MKPISLITLSLLIGLGSLEAGAVSEDCQKNQNDCKTACGWNAMGGKPTEMAQRTRKQFECLAACTDRFPCGEEAPVKTPETAPKQEQETKPVPEKLEE